MTPAPRPAAYYRRISKMRVTKGRRPAPTYQQIVADPRNAKVLRELRREFLSQNQP